MRIRITIKGQLGKEWIAWFNMLDIESDDNSTIISGEIADEAALHGVLNQIRDLNLKLRSVTLLESDETKYDSYENK